MPLMGYPGLGLTESTVKQNQFNHTVQFQSLSRLYDRFRPDAAMFLMDLSVEASGLGLAVRFPLDDTPTVEGHPVKSTDDLRVYRNVDILADGRVMVYLEVIRHMRAGLPVPVGAFVTGPFTLAALMMDANQLAMNVVLDPDLCHEALQFAANTVVRYGRALLDAGADFIMVLDPAAVMLGPDQYARFAGAYTREVVGLLSDTEIILHICGDTNHIIDAMVDTGAAGLSLDHPMDMPRVAERVGPQVTLIGNIDPVRVLHGTPEEVRAMSADLLSRMQVHPNFVLSTGCDLPQDTPLANLDALVDTGRAWATRSQAGALAQAAT